MPDSQNPQPPAAPPSAPSQPSGGWSNVPAAAPPNPNFGPGQPPPQGFPQPGPSGGYQQRPPQSGFAPPQNYGGPNNYAPPGQPGYGVAPPGYGYGAPQKKSRIGYWVLGAFALVFLFCAAIGLWIYSLSKNSTSAGTVPNASEYGAQAASTGAPAVTPTLAGLMGSWTAADTNGPSCGDKTVTFAADNVTVTPTNAESPITVPAAYKVREDGIFVTIQNASGGFSGNKYHFTTADQIMFLNDDHPCTYNRN